MGALLAELSSAAPAGLVAAATPRASASKPAETGELSLSSLASLTPSALFGVSGGLIRLYFPKLLLKQGRLSPIRVLLEQGSCTVARTGD